MRSVAAVLAVVLGALVLAPPARAEEAVARVAWTDADDGCAKDALGPRFGKCGTPDLPFVEPVEVEAPLPDEPAPPEALDVVCECPGVAVSLLDAGEDPAPVDPGDLEPLDAGDAEVFVARPLGPAPTSA